MRPLHDRRPGAVGGIREFAYGAESEILGVRESRSRPSCGIVSIRTRGLDQRAEVVIEFTRSFMVFKSDAPEVAHTFPISDDPSTV